MVDIVVLIKVDVAILGKHVAGTIAAGPHRRAKVGNALQRIQHLTVTGPEIPTREVDLTEALQVPSIYSDSGTANPKLYLHSLFIDLLFVYSLSNNSSSFTVLYICSLSVGIGLPMIALLLGSIRG